MEKGTLKIKFSDGFGNNIFQYCFGRLLSEYHNMNYCHDAIPELNIKEEVYNFNKKLKTVKFKANSNLEAKKYDKDHYKYFKPLKEQCNFDFYSFIFYFEDYTLYKPHLDKIRSWFPIIKKGDKENLVIHFRLKNRLIGETHYKNFIDPKIYRKVISDNFCFNKLYIVSDTEKWDYVTKKDIKMLHHEVHKKLGYGTNFVPVKNSVNYMNKLVDSLAIFNPILHHSKKLRDDFNFIRSFDKIIFKDSTFAWWAATLSKASKIGVFKPWKPNKGKKKNRNLGQTDFPGWFSWGSMKNLINKEIIYE